MVNMVVWNEEYQSKMLPMHTNIAKFSMYIKYIKEKPTRGPEIIIIEVWDIWEVGVVVVRFRLFANCNIRMMR